MFDKNNKIILKNIFKYYLITRIVLLFFIFFVRIVFSNTNSISLLFDNVHYLSIAKIGYTKDYQYAFFPLVPILIKCMGKVGFLILNQLLTIASSYLIFFIDNKILKNNNSYMAVILWLISPISIFTMMFYTEGLFIFLTLLSYLIYKLKKNYLLLGITLGLCVLTRSLGSVLFFTVFLFMFYNALKNREKFTNLLITFIPATFISCLYPIYLYFKTKNFLYFMNAQTYWLKVKSNIFMVFFDSFKLLDFSHYRICLLNYFFTLLLFIYIIYLIIKYQKEKKYYELLLYMALTLIFISFSIKGSFDPLTSYYRYIFGCFSVYFLFNRRPIFIALITTFTTVVTLFFLSDYYFF